MVVRAQETAGKVSVGPVTRALWEVETALASHSVHAANQGPGPGGGPGGAHTAIAPESTSHAQQVLPRTLTAVVLASFLRLQRDSLEDIVSRAFALARCTASHHISFDRVLAQGQGGGQLADYFITSTGAGADGAASVAGLVFEPDEDLLRPTRRGPQLNRLPCGSRWPEGAREWRSEAEFSFAT